MTAPAPLPIPRTRSWPAIVVAAIAAVVAVAALIVALTNARPAATPATTSVPTYTAAQTAAAQRQLCDTYKLVAMLYQLTRTGAIRHWPASRSQMLRQSSTMQQPIPP